MKTHLFLLLRSLAVALFGTLALLFMANRIALTSAHTVNARNELTAFSKKQGSLSELRREHDALKEISARLDAAIPTMDSITLVDDYLRTVARETGNIVTPRFGSSPTTAEGVPLSQLGLSMQVEGNIASLLAFLRRVETAPYLISVRSVSLSTAQNLNGPLSAALSAIVYLQAQP